MNKKEVKGTAWVLRYLQPNENFECIIDTPLCSSEGTNHDNTKWKTTSAKTQQSHFLHSLQTANNVHYKTSSINGQQRTMAA